MTYKTQLKLVFSIFGDQLNPQEFTALVKFSASDFWLKGDLNPHRNNLVRKETGWEYSTGFLETIYLEKACEIFFQKLNPCLDDVVSYILAKNLNTKIDIIIEIVDEEKPSIYFNKDFIKLISALEAEIDIDLYIVTSSQP